MSIPLKTLSLVIVLGIVALAGCTGTPATPETTPVPELADELIVSFWEEGMSQSIFDAFTEEYGVAINYQPYAVNEEPLQEMQAGTAFDVVIMDVTLAEQAIAENLLAEINYDNVPNHINIAASFRDLSFDPDNKYSIPFDWGTTGLIVRSDLFEGSINSWDALWQGEPGTIGLWDDPYSMLGITLLSLGYSANTQNEDELSAAFAKIEELQDKVVFLEQFDPWTSAYELESGNVTVTYGWAYDGLLGQELSPDIAYIIPEEGTILWLESMVIPHNAPNKYTAEVFLDFLLRPEIASQFVNEMYYAVANELLEPHVDPEIWENPIVYPSADILTNGEFMLNFPSELAEQISQRWQQFMDEVNQAN